MYRSESRDHADARVLREEDSCYVVAASYEPPSDAGFTTSRDILFWVDRRTFMVMKQQGDQGHRFPTEDEVRWTRVTTSVRNIRLNEGIPEDTFQFTPPADTTEVAPGYCGVSGSGGFIGQLGPDGRHTLEHRDSHEWQGDTLVEHSTWKIREMTLVFERRLTFADGEKEVRIAERIKGPQGKTEGSFRIPLE